MCVVELTMKSVRPLLLISEALLQLSNAQSLPVSHPSGLLQLSNQTIVHLPQVTSLTVHRQDDLV